MEKNKKVQLGKLFKNPAMSWIFSVSGKLKFGMFFLVLLNSAISISAILFALALKRQLMVQ